MAHLTRRLILAVLATLLSASAASAQHHGERFMQDNGPTIGPQAGFSTNNFSFYIGGQVSAPVASQFDFYPSFDIFFPGSGTTVWALNAEGRYWPKLAGLYLGGGVGISGVSGGASTGTPRIHRPAGASNAAAAPAIVGGWEFRAVRWEPFLQIHIVFGAYDRVEFGGGLNWRL